MILNTSKEHSGTCWRAWRYLSLWSLLVGLLFACDHDANPADEPTSISPSAASAEAHRKAAPRSPKPLVAAAIQTARHLPLPPSPSHDHYARDAGAPDPSTDPGSAGDPAPVEDAGAGDPNDDESFADAGASPESRDEADAGFVDAGFEDEEGHEEPRYYFIGECDDVYVYIVSISIDVPEQSTASLSLSDKGSGSYRQVGGRIGSYEVMAITDDWSGLNPKVYLRQGDEVCSAKLTGNDVRRNQAFKRGAKLRKKDSAARKRASRRASKAKRRKKRRKRRKKRRRRKRRKKR